MTTSRLKTVFNPSPIYSAREPSNHKLFKKYKISPVHKFTSNKTYTNIEHKIFEEIVPSVSPLLKKHIRPGHAGIVDHSVDLSIPDVKKKKRERESESNRRAADRRAGRKMKDRQADRWILLSNTYNCCFFFLKDVTMDFDDSSPPPTPFSPDVILCG